MNDSNAEADELNIRLDLAAKLAESDVLSGDLPAEWQRVVAAGAETPDPHPEFVESLRDVLAGHIVAAPAATSPSRRIGIVAYPASLDRSTKARTGSRQFQAARMTVAAAIAAMFLALFLTAPPWNREDHHGIGIPTAGARSTAIAATATATPATLATYADATGRPSET